MSKLQLTKPVLIMIYGYPGAGKSYFARQFCETVQAAHLDSDRIRHEVFQVPAYNKQEDEVINNISFFMAEEFIKAGVSLVYDANVTLASQRFALRDLARKYQADYFLIWMQTDLESSFLRVIKRDRRKADDKYATPYDRSRFDDVVEKMQNPKNESYVVVSGKHTFNSQKAAVLNKLYEAGLVSADQVSNLVVKPELVNLVPSLRQGRVDPARRNIVIR